MSRLPDRREPPPLYAADAGDARELWRADAIARMGAADARAPGTFLPSGPGPAVAAGWERWLGDPLEAWLGRAFVDLHRAAGRMDAEGLVAIDRTIDRRLDPEARARSREAARPWLEGRTEVRRQPLWDKYQRARASAGAPGHLPTVFALQSALFHLPLLPALTAYVIFEGVNGRAAVEPGKRRDPEAFASRHPEALEAVRRVFRAASEGAADTWPASV